MAKKAVCSVKKNKMEGGVVMKVKVHKFEWYDKQLFTIEEASRYFGIGQTILRRYIKEHDSEDFIVSNGRKILIKRDVFKKYVDEKLSVL